MRVLGVEDDRAIAALVAQSLKEHHYAVDIDEDGAIDWESAESAAYDLHLRWFNTQRMDLPYSRYVASFCLED
ncbi:hypothetical protein H6F89_21540 [Cyanobacteria bacterium FACHB-63]|nr:hypothetical protein [Cyanobacteria bacterium FACHB-63]